MLKNPTDPKFLKLYRLVKSSVSDSEKVQEIMDLVSEVSNDTAVKTRVSLLQLLKIV